jgi:hypothetical protein
LKKNVHSKNALLSSRSVVLPQARGGEIIALSSVWKRVPFGYILEYLPLVPGNTQT